MQAREELLAMLAEASKPKKKSKKKVKKND